MGLFSKKKEIVKKKRVGWLKIMALILIAIGVILLISSGFGITGNVVGVSDSEVVNKVGFWTGVVLIVAGAILGMSDRREGSGLVEIAKEHEQAHNVVNYRKYVGELDRRKDTTPKVKVSEKELESYRSLYGEPPKSGDKSEVITLYHAYPRAKSRTPGIFIDRRKTKGRPFAMADDPVNATIEVSAEDGDPAIQKIEISREAYDDLDISVGDSHITGGKVYKIAPSKVDLANKLHKAGYIILGRGR